MEGSKPKALSGKEALLAWCQKNTKEYPTVNIENFDSSWKDGLGFCALIHHFRPDLIPNFSSLSKNEPEKNLTLAFKLAEEELGVGTVIDVEHILESEKPDSFGIIAYLSQFYHLFGGGEEISRRAQNTLRKSVFQQDRCRKCRQKLKGPTIPFNDRFMYHLSCFECTQCKKQLNDKYISVSNKPYCERCGTTTWTETIRAKSHAREHENARQQMQEKAFKNWINNNLGRMFPENPPQVTNLQTDLCNGVLLIHLLKGIYGDRVTVPNYNKDPKLPVQYLDNATLVCNILEQLGYTDLNIKPQNIVNGDLKMMMGLIWKMILDLQVSTLSRGKKKSTNSQEDASKHALLDWCNGRLQKFPKEKKVEDFGTSFQDGVALLGLVYAQNPELVDPKSIDSNNKAENLSLAFQLAEREFGIPPLIEVSDMLKSKPDEMSVMIYVSEFVYYSSLLQKDPSELTPEEKIRLATAKQRLGGNIEIVKNDEEEMMIENVTSFNWEELSGEGFLKIQGATFPHFWRKKWFSLQGSRLLIYKDAVTPMMAEQIPQDYISLSFVQSCEENKVKKNAFMLVSADRVYHLQADSKSSMEKWVVLINKALKVWKKKPMVTKLTTISPQQKEYKEGYLYQLNILKKWKKKFCVLKDGTLYILKMKGERSAKRVPLYGCTFEEYRDPQEHTNNERGEYVEPTAFKITTTALNLNNTKKFLVLRAENWMEMHAWLNACLRQQLIIEEYIRSITVSFQLVVKVA